MTFSYKTFLTLSNWAVIQSFILFSLLNTESHIHNPNLNLKTGNQLFKVLILVALECFFHNTAVE